MICTALVKVILRLSCLELELRKKGLVLRTLLLPRFSSIGIPILHLFINLLRKGLTSILREGTKDYFGNRL
jgi:hypothetical protein